MQVSICIKKWINSNAPSKKHNKSSPYNIGCTCTQLTCKATVLATSMLPREMQYENMQGAVDKHTFMQDVPVLPQANVAISTPQCCSAVRCLDSTFDTSLHITKTAEFTHPHPSYLHKEKKEDDGHIVKKTRTSNDAHPAEYCSTWITNSALAAATGFSPGEVCTVFETASNITTRKERKMGMHVSHA